MPVFVCHNVKQENQWLRVTAVATSKNCWSLSYSLADILNSSRNNAIKELNKCYK